MREDVPGENLREEAWIEVMGTGASRMGWTKVGTHQTGIPLPFQVPSTQHVLGDSFLAGSPPVQAFAEFRVDDGYLQLLKGLRVGQGHWEQRRESGPM